MENARQQQQQSSQQAKSRLSVRPSVTQSATLRLPATHSQRHPLPLSTAVALLIDVARNLLKIKRTETEGEGGTPRIVWAASIAVVVVFPF